MRALSFGEVLFDVIEGIPYLGGAPLNFAAHLAQGGQESYIISRVGADDLGKKARQQMEKFGVNTTFLQIDARYSTGTVEVMLRNGQPDYNIVEDVAYDFICQENQQELMNCMPFDLLYFGTLAQRNAQSAAALNWLIKQQKVNEIFYDVNLRRNNYTKDVIHDSLHLCTILKLNDDEVKVLSEMFYQEQLSIESLLKRLANDFNIPVMIVTAGEKGCYVYQSAEIFYIKGTPVQVIDTIGAGDAFSAAFVNVFFKSKDAVKAGIIANKLGSYVAASRGGIPSYSPYIKKLLER